jgi:nucleoside-diphosphate-sugar epimerase
MLNAYVASKVAAERAVAASHRPAVILRPHAIYGPGDSTLVPRALRARRWGRLLAAGDGRNLLSLTHIDNLVHAIDRALTAPIAGVEAFNIADPIVGPVDDVLRAFLRAFDLPERVAYIPLRPAWVVASGLERAYGLAGARRAPALTRYMVAQLAVECTLDIGKAVHRLGYAPRPTYRTSFAEVAAAYRRERSRAGR